MPIPADPSSIRRPGSVGGALKDGAAFNAAQTLAVLIVTAGLARFRIRARTTAAATLRLRFIRSDKVQYSTDDEYDTNQPADVALAANTENKLDVDPHMGEGLAIVSIIGGAGAGAVDYCDFLPI